jgi:hypothetical protein
MGAVGIPVQYTNGIYVWQAFGSQILEAIQFLSNTFYYSLFDQGYGNRVVLIAKPAECCMQGWLCDDMSWSSVSFQPLYI